MQSKLRASFRLPKNSISFDRFALRGRTRSHNKQFDLIKTNQIENKDTNLPSAPKESSAIQADFEPNECAAPYCGQS
jgi:hypothetical protein